MSPARPPISARSLKLPLAAPPTPTRRSSQCRAPRRCTVTSAGSRRSMRPACVRSVTSITAARRRTCGWASSQDDSPSSPPSRTCMPPTCQRPSGRRTTARCKPSICNAARRGSHASSEASQSKRRLSAATRVMLPSLPRTLASRREISGVLPRRSALRPENCTGCPSAWLTTAATCCGRWSSCGSRTRRALRPAAMSTSSANAVHASRRGRKPIRRRMVGVR